MEKTRFALTSAPGRIASREPIAARVSGTLYLLGAALVLVSISLKHPAGTNVFGLIGVAAFAAVSGALMIAGANRAPAWFIHVVVIVSCVAVNAAIYFAGIASSVYSMMFVWSALVAAYFFRRPHLVVHLAWLLGTYAATLALVSRSETHLGAYSPLVRWLVTAVVLSGGAGLVSYLVARRIHAETELDELRRQAQGEARTDPLTGLPNRRCLEEELGRAIANARRTEAQLGVAVLDLDYFKRFNDRHGHAAGDHLLQTVAGAWTEFLRAGDFLARYGGDEFVLLLLDCPIAEVQAVVSRLCGAIPHEGTCSAGIAAWSIGESAAEVLHRADDALYAVKSNGRNRFAVAS
jgi:diguanylate cyclase (GGDEF)-like protein